MAIIDDIKSRYPNPGRCFPDGSHPGHNYCVGGSIVLYARSVGKLSKLTDQYQHDTGDYFPRPGYLGTILTILNPQLPSELAHAWAGQITKYNDRGDFEEAWNITQQALEYIPRQED
jgi:hypothetical protein